VHGYREALAVGAQRINAVCNAISGKEPAVAALLHEYDRGRLRLLIATATDVEDRILKEVFEKEQMHIIHSDFSGRSSIRYLGLHGGVNVHHVRSSAGGAGPSGAQAVVGEVIQRLRPNMIVSCGICAGLKPDKQRLGEIVVSTVVRHYEAQRVNEGLRDTPRGSRPDASPLLLDRVRDLLLYWNHCTVHQGIVMSGDKLVDNRNFRARLLRIEPEALACEMEGAGITSEAERHKVEWLIVKGICDFAAAKTKDQQGHAAGNAFSLLAALIKRGGLNATEVLRP